MKEPPDTNVISVRFGLKDGVAEVRPKFKKKKAPYRPYCEHEFEYDPHDRTVECPKCKAKFDAWEALEFIARDWLPIEQNLAYYKSEIKRLAADKEELERQVRNLKSRVRRGQKESDSR